MRYFGRSLMVLLILATLGWLGQSSWQTIARWVTADTGSLQRLGAANMSLGSVLTTTEWTVFGVSAAHTTLKVVTNANIPAWLETQPDDEWQYAVHYQLLNDAGDVLTQHTYHHRTRVTKYKEETTGEELRAAFYMRQDLVPADGRIILINLLDLLDPLDPLDPLKLPKLPKLLKLADKAEVSMIRLRLAAKDESISDVTLRCYYREDVPKHKLGHFWQRLSNTQKAGLAKGSVYPQALLSPQEKRNLLLSGLWQPLGPRGIEGRDYTRRELYILKEYEGDAVDDPPLPAGLFVDQGGRGVIPLPENGGQVRLEFVEPGIGAQPDTPADTPASASPLQVRWYGRGLSKRATYAVVWNGSSTRFEHVLPGGLLEVEAPRAVVVRAFLVQDEQAREITPEPMYVRAYIARSGLPVDFGVSHVERRPTPFRVDLRQALPAQEGGRTERQVSVWYELLDAQEHVVKSGKIVLAPSASLYDRLREDDLGVSVSEAASYYFSLPEDVTRIRFTATPPVLISAYTRPVNLARGSRVPEDAYRSADNDERQPAWFAVRPSGSQHLRTENRSALLTVQHRPPADKPEILAGQYLWEDYHPQGSWLARPLFTPREDSAPLRDETLPALYRPVSVGQDVRLHFRAPRGGRSVQPKLIFFRSEEAVFPLQVFVDGRLHYQARLGERAGEIQLPAIAVGRHQVRCVAPGHPQFFINHVDPAGSGAFLKRLANRFDAAGLSFVYDKKSADEDLLSIRLYVPHGTTQRSQIHVQIDTQTAPALTPTTSQTFLRRSYDVRPAEGNAVRVLHTQAEYVDQGQVFFIPLGSDLPPGPYRIRFCLEHGPGGYLILSKLTPGIFEQRTLFQETAGSATHGAIDG